MRTGWTLCVVVSALASGCTQDSDPESPPPSQALPAPVVADAAGASAPAGFVGVLLSGHTVDVAAELDGQVKEIYARLGEPVNKAARIARIDDRLVRQQLAMAKAALAAAVAKEAKARIDKDEAQQRFDRRRELSKAVSKEDLETARFKVRSSGAGLKISSAEVAEQRANVQHLTAQLAKAVIRAPFAGSVTLRYVDEGAIVNSGQPIVRLLGTEGYRVRFAVPPEQSAQVAVGKAIRFDVKALGTAFGGAVTHVAQEVDAAAHMIFVEGTLQVPERWRASMRAGLVGRVFVDVH